MLLTQYKFKTLTLILSSSLFIFFNACSLKTLPPNPENQSSIQETPEDKEQINRPEGLTEEDIDNQFSDREETQSFILEEDTQTPTSSNDEGIQERDIQNMEEPNGIEVSPKKSTPPNKEDIIKQLDELKSSKKSFIPDSQKDSSQGETKDEKFIPFVGNDHLNKPDPGGKDGTENPRYYDHTYPFPRPYKNREFPLKNIFFYFGKHDLRPLSKLILKKNAVWLKENTKVKIEIQGHCDERGTNNYNLALGERRAQATKEYLISLGISGDRIATISYGEEKPFCTEHTKKCWRQNRRSHFLATR